MMSEACARSPGAAAQAAPWLSRAAALSGERFQTAMGKPAFRMLAAMGCPMRPTPAMPMVGRGAMSDPPAVAETVDDDGEDEDDADGDGLDIGLDADEVHAIGEDGDEQRAEDGAHDAAFAAA